MSGSTASAWWQLLRAGNVFTAVSNILAGFLLAHGEWQPVWPLVILIVSSIGLYLAGMVLNDVFDLEIDRVERPERPLPSGRIEPLTAKLIGWGLVLDGLTGAALAAWLIGSWMPLVVAGLLALTIVGYDTVLKQTPLGPLTMGACRALNVLLGASACTDLPQHKVVFLYAGLVGVYTVALTLLARDEAGTSSPRAVKSASNLAQSSILAVAIVAVLVPPLKLGWLAAWLILWIVVRIVTYEPYIDPSPPTVRQSVSRLITLFIPLDALTCVAAAGWPAGLCVLTLLAPTYVATRRAPMT